jgi:hypothetical protein
VFSSQQGTVAVAPLAEGPLPAAVHATAGMQPSMPRGWSQGGKGDIRDLGTEAGHYISFPPKVVLPRSALCVTHHLTVQGALLCAVQFQESQPGVLHQQYACCDALQRPERPMGCRASAALHGCPLLAAASVLLLECECVERAETVQACSAGPVFWVSLPVRQSRQSV